MSNSIEAIKVRLNEIFVEVFDNPALQIFEEMTAKDIDDWDSLMHITLIVAVEKEFGVRLNAAEVAQFENVGSLINLLVARATK